jgi:DNA-binding response OmpR family regulator
MSPTKPKILLIDDDMSLAVFLVERFKRDGFDITAARNGREGLERVRRDWPDVVLLDLMLPGMDGEEVARRIKQHADIPVIVLSAVAASESKIEMLTRYAEDYVTKPFHYDELEARIRRVLRRTGPRPSPLIRLGPDLTLDLARRKAVVGGEVRSISPTETRLLDVLAAQPGKAVTSEELLAAVWNAADSPDPTYVWVTIRRLRQKIELDPDHPTYLVTVPGSGYRLESVDPGDLAS